VLWGATDARRYRDDDEGDRAVVNRAEVYRCAVIGKP